MLYTAKTHTTGGRDGAAHSDDGRLAVKLSSPGTPGSGTNPEQLFASARRMALMTSPHGSRSACRALTVKPHRRWWMARIRCARIRARHGAMSTSRSRWCNSNGDGIAALARRQEHDGAEYRGRADQGGSHADGRPVDPAISGDHPGEELVELRRRIAATRWPTKELVEDRSQGVQRATLRELARYWTTEYDWRKFQARLNALPQFTTEIDGVKIHFIHVSSRHEHALPLIMTHGWPGSVSELLETVGPLTDPTKYGGTPSDAFHVVLPSLPGYGFSGEPTELGWDSGRIARAWAKLMERLGYTRYVAQGGDVGADVTDAMGRQAPKGLLGIHLNLLAGALGIVDQLPAKSEQERAAHKALATFTTSGFGYFLEQSTRPQTIGYSLLDSPVGLAAWLLDHDTDSYYKISRAFVDGKPVGNLTRDSIIDNITLYWLTATGASAARWYWEFGQVLAAARAAGGAPPAVSVPVGFTTFPGEIWAAPRSWVETVYPGVAYFNEVDRGGHFAAWEQPALFASELRAAFKSIR